MKLPTPPPPWTPLFDRVIESDRFRDVSAQVAAGPTVDGRYRHWHKLQHLTPPDGLTHEEWWVAIKMSRGAGLREIALRDKAGRPFRYGLPDEALRLARGIDVDLSGQVALPRDAASPEQRDRYLFNSLTEEAITSSQLEGAVTTRVVAKEMLRTGREPRDASERMVLGNFRVMQRVREIADAPMTPAAVLDLQRTATEGTLSPERQGLRQSGVDDHDVGVYSGDTLLHKPPPAGQLAERLDAMCAFANDPGDEGPFMPPVVRAIVLHFWLAYDHPFVDGNGRTARALFYWSMLRQGHWLAEHVSISRILRKAPARYVRSFLYTETDDNDLTYFVLHQLDVLDAGDRQSQAVPPGEGAGDAGGPRDAHAARCPEPPAGGPTYARAPPPRPRVHVRVAPDEPRRLAHHGTQGLARLGGARVAIEPPPPAAGPRAGVHGTT